MEAQEKKIDVIENLFVLHNNPFLFSELFTEFYGAMGPQKNGVLLAYLVLPLVLPEQSRKVLYKDRGRTRLMTFAAKPERLYGLQGRIDTYRALTNVTLQHLLSCGRLSMTADLSLEVCGKVVDEPLAPREALAASRKLGTIVAPYDVPTIFRMLGVMSL
ncbi:hypothetical protein CTP10_R47190 [Cupriavidus sp. P-10]|uniref:three component ABC system middle component n=1 Tax=Cupriavidus sp. P-10 TaxID=2027911 RepID=UPI000E2F92DE|nr:three component ABC system middle component [Cupriavidus sp. P-10]BDB27314.1 hypothetical protein CTP10_R47190 [Cupriavidus sp. P-10]